VQHGLAALLRPTWKSFVGVWAVALVIAPGDTFRRSYELKLSTKSKINAKATLRVSTIGKSGCGCMP
jgi:hypothetical protein